MTKRYQQELKSASLIDAAENVANAAFKSWEQSARLSIMYARLLTGEIIAKEISNFYATPAMRRKHEATLRRSRFHIVKN